jgi:hypothetical protein
MQPWQTSYFIIGSFNSWEEPVKMEAVHEPI